MPIATPEVYAEMLARAQAVGVGTFMAGSRAW